MCFISKKLHHFLKQVAIDLFLFSVSKTDYKDNNEDDFRLWSHLEH